MNTQRSIAYFSMEIGLEAGMPTYSGGLGLLAGDTIRAAADLRVPIIAITLLHRKGYFFQSLDAAGRQSEEPVAWVVEDFLKELPQRASVLIEGRTVHLRAWLYNVGGSDGFTEPVFFLDADLPENSEWDRTLTHFLYGGDIYHRLCQEALLGIGGIRMLRELGFTQIKRYHMNEGHAALITVELLHEEAQKAARQQVNHEDIDVVREKCIFTTHTPVPAGHDQFPLDLVRRVFGRKHEFFNMHDIFCADLVSHVLGGGKTSFDKIDFNVTEKKLNMIYLALNLSRYVNGVAKKHGEVSQLMFAGYAVDAITNGVHGATWAAEPFQELYDRYIPGWRQDNFNLRYALSIPKEEIWHAHAQAKKWLISVVNYETNAGMDVDVLTIGFARRAATYKRNDLIFQDIERLRGAVENVGKVQLVFSGKAHPYDQEGKKFIERIFQFKEALKGDIRIAYLPNYDMELGRMMTAGVDVWLNTPQPPMEATGTSGMKAAINGVPSLSILDGWWIEGHIEGVTGWAVGETIREGGHDRSQDSVALYDKLEQAVIPLFYQDRDRFINLMRHSIALNGSFFNTHRMLQQYALKAYL